MDSGSRSFFCAGTQAFGELYSVIKWPLDVPLCEDTTKPDDHEDQASRAFARARKSFIFFIASFFDEKLFYDFSVEFPNIYDFGELYSVIKWPLDIPLCEDTSKPPDHEEQAPRGTAALHASWWASRVVHVCLWQVETTQGLC